MKKYYYTLDVDFYIRENADIRYVEAETYEEAETKIENIFKDNFPNLKEIEDIEVMTGEFRECWIRTFSSGYAYNAQKNGIAGVPCSVSFANGELLITPNVEVLIPNVLSWEELPEEIENNFLSIEQRQRRVIELILIVLAVIAFSLFVGYSV